VTYTHDELGLQVISYTVKSYLRQVVPVPRSTRTYGNSYTALDLLVMSVVYTTIYCLYCLAAISAFSRPKGSAGHTNKRPEASGYTVLCVFVVLVSCKLL